MSKKVTQAAMHKLEQIAKHQSEVKRLLRELEKSYPELLEYDDEGEDFSSVVDRQGSIFKANELVRYFEKWINTTREEL